MIFIAFDVAEVGRIGGAVHTRGAVVVGRQAVLAHHGMAQSEAHATGFAIVPRLFDRTDDPGGGELDVSHRRHGAQVHTPARPLHGDFETCRFQLGRHFRIGAGFRGAVRVRGVQHNLVRCNFGQGFRHFLAHACAQIITDPDQVDGDHDHRFHRFAIFGRLEYEGRCGDRVQYAGGDPRAGKAGEDHGLIRRDIGRGPTDFEAVRFHVIGGRRGCQHRENRTGQDQGGEESASAHGALLVHGMGSIVWRASCGLTGDDRGNVARTTGCYVRRWRSCCDTQAFAFSRPNFSAIIVPPTGKVSITISCESLTLSAFLWVRYPSS